MEFGSQVINAGGVVSMQAGTLADRPAAGILGRIYIRTDVTPNTQFRDTGSTWVQIGGGGAGGNVNGSGTQGRLVQWTGTTDIGDSPLVHSPSGQTVYHASITDNNFSIPIQLAADTYMCGNNTTGSIFGGINPNNSRIEFSSFLQIYDALQILLNCSTVICSGTISTAPTLSGSGAWNLGVPSNSTVVFDTTRFVSVTIDGIDYKLAMAV